MKYAVLLCDKQWNIEKVLHQSQDAQLPPAASLPDLLADPAPLAQNDLFEGQSQNFLLLTLKDGTQVPAFLCTYAASALVFLVHICSEADFIEFSQLYAKDISWADQTLQDYQDEYYRISQMNNQLINSQRALMKSNLRYRQLLDEIQDANNLITLLEQDELTILLRSPALYSRANEQLSAARGQQFELLVLDLEPLKQINELFGRKSGDRLLQDFALFLLGLEENSHTIFARATGNAFLAFAPAEQQLHILLQQKAEQFLEQYPLPVRLRCKIGGCTAVADGTLTAEEMQDRARLALETLRGSTQSGTAFYNEALHEKLLLQHKILDNVQTALVHGELQLYLQPKVRLTDGSMFGAEALVRWFHPELGFVPPNYFIPLLEEEGAIYPVDQYIWEQACRVLQKRRELRLPMHSISVNVARSDFYQSDLLDVLLRLVHKYGLQPSQLRLEMLERAYVQDSARLFEVLTQLRGHGFSIEMDDFGVGESSLAMLANIPVDTIKLDRQFLVTALENPRHIEVIRCIIQLARTLQIGIIAEGVETPDQADMLLNLGCYHAQGYLYGRPEPAKNFLK